MNDTDTPWLHRLVAAPDDVNREMTTLLERRPDQIPGPGSYGAAIRTLIRAADAAGMSVDKIISLPKVAAYLRMQLSPAELETLHGQAVVRCIVARMRASRRAGAETEGRLTIDQARALAITDVQLAPIDAQLKDDLIGVLDDLFQPMYTKAVD